MSRGIQWGKMAFELRHEVEKRNRGQFPKAAFLSMHPEDVAELQSDLRPEDFYSLFDASTEPPRFLGIYILANDLLPEGHGILTSSSGAIVATVNFDECVINATTDLEGIRAVPLFSGRR